MLMTRRGYSLCFPCRFLTRRRTATTTTFPCLLRPGALLIVDQGNHSVRALRDGRVSTLAGQGDFGLEIARATFADGPRGVARFRYPRGCAYDAARGRLLVADTHNSRVRSVNVVRQPAPTAPARARTRATAWRGAVGAVQTLAGDGVRASRDGPAAAASLLCPAGLVLADDGTLCVARDLVSRQDWRVARSPCHVSLRDPPWVATPCSERRSVASVSVADAAPRHGVGGCLFHHDEKVSSSSRPRGVFFFITTRNTVPLVGVTLSPRRFYRATHASTSPLGS